MKPLHGISALSLVGAAMAGHTGERLSVTYDSQVPRNIFDTICGMTTERAHPIAIPDSDAFKFPLQIPGWTLESGGYPQDTFPLCLADRSAKDNCRIQSHVTFSWANISLVLDFPQISHFHHYKDIRIGMSHHPQSGVGHQHTQSIGEQPIYVLNEPEAHTVYSCREGRGLRRKHGQNKYSTKGKACSVSPSGTSAVCVIPIKDIADMYAEIKPNRDSDITHVMCPHGANAGGLVMMLRIEGKVVDSQGNETRMWNIPSYATPEIYDHLKYRYPMRLACGTDFTGWLQLSYDCKSCPRRRTVTKTVYLVKDEMVSVRPSPGDPGKKIKDAMTGLGEVLASHLPPKKPKELPKDVVEHHEKMMDALSGKQISLGQGAVASATEGAEDARDTQTANAVTM